MLACMSRIETLKQLLEQDPASSFARYGLAMEYMNTANSIAPQRSSKSCSKPAIPPTRRLIFMAARRYSRSSGRLEDARDYYRRGIEATRDPHARSELQAALDILGD